MHSQVHSAADRLATWLRAEQFIVPLRSSKALLELRVQRTDQRHRAPPDLCLPPYLDGGNSA